MTPFPLRWHRLAIVTAMMPVLVACNTDSGSNTSQAGLEPDRPPAAFNCIAQSPWLKYGEGLHQPSRQPVPAPASHGSSASDSRCGDNRNFRFAAAKADITGPAGGKIHMGNEDPMNYSAGIHLRQYARSFIVASPCNGKRVAMVLTDTGMLFESVRQAVLDRIAADAELSRSYGPDNVMMSATHTHSAPGGQAHYTAYNLLRLGHDPQAFDVTVAGIFESLKQAHSQLQAGVSDGRIRINQGELLGANKSRAIPAYLNNTEAERSQYQDVQGGDITTNRLMTLLRLQRDSGEQVASINWFAVHPTSDSMSEYGLGAVPISGDNKGYAAYLFERLQASQANAEAFVAGFMQADEGDAFTQLWFDNDEMRARRQADLPPNEPSPVTVANGTAQLNRALSLYTSASETLRGPVDYRLSYVKMDAVEITDPVVLASLQHPADMDADPKRTCTAAMGVSFPAAGHGAQPGETGAYTPAGVSCKDPNYAQAVQTNFINLVGGNAPAWLFSYAVGCNLQQAPGVDLACQAEKPVLFVLGPPLNLSANIVPFQLLRLGNLAIVGLPWEITTMAGRRIRDTVSEALRDDGVDYVVITGLANDYVSYLTTREEYALQMYEGASNQFGPWSLAAVQQELRRLALNMRDGVASASGPLPPRSAPQLLQTLPLQGLDAAPLGSTFGAVLEDTQPRYAPGDTARAVFQASSPNSDLKTGGSFLWVERRLASGQWQVVARDADPETSFVWHSESPQPQFVASPYSKAEILWRIPRNTAPGRYRLRYEGVANTATQRQPYSGESSEFLVDGPAANCP